MGNICTNAELTIDTLIHNQVAKLTDDGVLLLCDCLQIVVMNVFFEEVPKEEMLMSNRVRAERTQVRFPVDTEVNGNDSSAAMP